ncbi:MAG TPA: PilZ domain-containing protein [Thermoanaerobaculia bacterium]|nr:PilZ domain-containing protein [Thermoanaerobaculia bacterium]
METRENKKPRYQRIALVEPLTASISGLRAALIDISLSGALVAHKNALTVGTSVTLQFDWNGEIAEIVCDVIRVEPHRQVTQSGSSSSFRSGVHFTKYRAESDRVLRVMITDLVSRALDEQKANARGVPAIAASSFQTGTTSSGYVTHRFIKGSWTRTASGSPQQPVDGFTVSAEEDPAQVQLLCETYASCKFEDRKMIRDMAALSISNEQGVPTRRYEP